MSGYKLQINEHEFTLNTPNESSEQFISCILTTPLSEEQANSEDYPADKKLDLTNSPYPDTRRGAIIVHGIGGHKNYTYHSKLARKLAHEQGVYSIRFDFRNCGSSSKTGKKGRTLQNDLEDCHVVYKWLSNGGFKGRKVIIDALIGHSRGVVDVFNYQLQHMDIYIPNLVACAGRFIGKGLPESIKKVHPNFEQEGGHWIKGFQDGSYTNVWVPLEETNSLGELYMNSVKKICKETDTLLIYGLKEEIIPLEDATHYSNCLGDRNTLVLLPDATHSFYGDFDIPVQEWNQSKIPINKSKGRHDYNYEVCRIITDWLSPISCERRFYEKALNIHEFLPRWKDVEGVANFRDIGGWKTSMPQWPGAAIKWGKVFRSANTDFMTPKGQENLKALGIKKIFDFRMPFEIKETNFELLSDVEFISLCPPNKTEMGLEFYYNLAKSWKNYDNVYKGLLDNVIPFYKPIFEHLRDHADIPILYHCTAGKDRTGTVTAIILSLLGVPDALVAKEYELTSEGLKPAYPEIKKLVNPLFSELSQKFQLESGWTLEKDGFENLFASKYETMLEFLMTINTEYDGVENYLKSKMGFSNEDLDLIRSNMLF